MCYVKAPLEHLADLSSFLVSRQISFDYNGGLTVKVELPEGKATEFEDKVNSIRKKCKKSNSVFEYECYKVEY